MVKKETFRKTGYGLKGLATFVGSINYELDARWPRCPYTPQP